MKPVLKALVPLLTLMLLVVAWKPLKEETQQTPKIKRYLYVATPGVRDYLGYGGHGIQVFDMDNHYKFVKFIPTSGFHPDGTPSNVKGVCVSLTTNCIYVSTLEGLQCIDLTTEKLVWEKKFEGGADRMAVSPDGKTIYLPSLEKEFWNVVDAKTGDIITKIVTNSGSHNTLYGLSGNNVYLAGLKSPYLAVADAKTHTIVKQIGPFNAEVRPFTINGSETLAYVNINSLLGFEIGDIKTGKKLYRVEVQGFNKGEVKRHGCPTHGIALTPDEKEVWICDGANNRIHIFDNTVLPPRQVNTITVKDMPGWINFSLDGKHAFSATGDIIDVKTRKIIVSLEDQNYNSVQSEKMVEIHFNGKKPVRAGDQFGMGKVVKN